MSQRTLYITPDTWAELQEAASILAFQRKAPVSISELVRELAKEKLQQLKEASNG